MKDKHTINLILISSRWFNSFLPKIVHDEVILGSSVSPSLFPEFQVFLSYIVAMFHQNHCKGAPCVSNYSFFLSSFYYRSSSLRLYMVVRQGFLSFFNCSSSFLSKLWSAKLYSKINMVLNTWFFLRSSSILLLSFQSAILSTLSFEMVLYHSWQFPFMFRDSQVVKNEVF